MSQKNAVLRYLRTHKGITQLVAFHQLGVTRLSERIRELKQDGYPINDQWVAVNSRYGSTRVKQYQLVAA